jgi:periplasmic divalent cation tolerance protein
MLMIGWTTVAERSHAEELARGLLEARLVACVQIEGPISSWYRWEGKVESAAEFRLMVKFIPARAGAVQHWVLQHHPYTTPEWVVVRAENVSEKYLSWAGANSSNPPL